MEGSMWHLSTLGTISANNSTYPFPETRFWPYLFRSSSTFWNSKYQGKDFSPFQTHPKMMRVAVVSLLLYCSAYDFEKRLCSPAYAHIVRSGRAVFGSLLSVSLASVLFQDSVWLPLIFVYILFSNWEILNYRVKGMCNWFQRRMNRRNLLPV